MPIMALARKRSIIIDKDISTALGNYKQDGKTFQNKIFQDYWSIYLQNLDILNYWLFSREPKLRPYGSKANVLTIRTNCLENNWNLFAFILIAFSSTFQKVIAIWKLFEYKKTN